MTEKEIEEGMTKSLGKIPWEIRKIKFVLFFVGLWRELRRRMIRYW